MADVELTEELQSKAAKHVNDLYNEYDKKCEEFRGIATKAWITWANKQDNRIINDISNIGVGETHINCETWIPRLFMNIFPYRYFYDFDTSNPQKELVKKYYRNLFDDMKYEHKQKDGIRVFVVEGMVWYKTYLDMSNKEVVEYSYEEKENWNDNPLVKMIQEATTKMTGKPPVKVVKHRKYFNKPAKMPQIRLVPSERMVYDTELDSIEDMTWLIEKVDISPSSLKQNPYINYDKLEEKVISKMSDVEKNIGKKIPCIECHGLFDYNGDGEPIMCLITKPVDVDFIVRCEPHPYDHKKLPYSVDRLFVMKGRFAGIGIPELTERPQGELDSKRNLIATAETAALWGTTYLGSAVRADKGDFENPRPGKVVKLKGGSVGDIKIEKNEPRIEGALKLDAITKNEMQRMAKVSMTQQGVVKGGETTAFEVSSALREGNQAIKFVIESYTLNIIEDNLGKIQSSVSQYLDDNEIVNVDGQDLKAIDIKKIGKFKLLGVNNLEHEAINAKFASDNLMISLKTPMVQGANGKMYPVNQKKSYEEWITAQHKENPTDYVGQEPVNMPVMPTGGESPEPSKGNPIFEAIQGMFKKKSQ